MAQAVLVGLTQVAFFMQVVEIQVQVTVLRQSHLLDKQRLQHLILHRFILYPVVFILYVLFVLAAVAVDIVHPMVLQAVAAVGGWDGKIIFLSHQVNN
jgi:hypothetical protein